MKTAYDYYRTDVRHRGLAVGGSRSVNVIYPDGTVVSERIECTVYYDRDSSTQFYSVFVPAGPHTVGIAHWVVKNLEEAIHVTKIGMNLREAGREPVNSSDLMFSGSLLLYTADEIDPDSLATIRAEAEQRGVKIRYCGPAAAHERWSADRPAAFLSHDSRDKKVYAGPLALALSKKGLKVWYDEYSLRVGDSLRESIEKGLKECRACIVLLSRNYLGNPGWTKREFNGVFTREMIEQTNLILPVWIDVTREDVFHYSPELADRFAARWADGKKNVVQHLVAAMAHQKSR